MTTEPRTYGIFALTFHGLTMKEVSELGYVYDVKWTFNRNARPERIFAAESSSVVFGADKTDGLKLEIRPMLDGQELPSILVPTTLRGDLTLDTNGNVRLGSRVSHEALENAGLSTSVFLNAGFALECTVSDQPTLEEQTEAQIQAELGALPLFGTGEGQALPEVNTDEVLTEMSEAPDGPPMTDTGAPPSITLDPKAEGEDLPFPLDDGAAD